MKPALRIFSGALIMLPAAWLICDSTVALYELWTDQVFGSFGLQVRLGPIAIAYPWADAFVIACSTIVLLCGLAIVSGKYPIAILFIAGSSILALVTLGIVGTL